VRGLLGPKGAALGWSELIAEMADLSKELLEIKRFGKNCAEADRLTSIDSGNGLSKANSLAADAETSRVKEKMSDPKRTEETKVKSTTKELAMAAVPASSASSSVPS